jgi:phage FluMu protein Com
MKHKGKLYRELRCHDCRKLICFEYVYAGRVFFDCPRCGTPNEFVFKHLKTTENEDNIKKEFTIDSNKLKNREVNN